ncbi:MAG TPA: hypothetical protein VFV50_07105 [Bdellovibrionales bacterium]|nr:hypothetical protein [Bdellovibrionales bacterium]
MNRASKLLTHLAVLALSASPNFAQSSEPGGSSKTVATQMALRDLWVDHVFWVRNVVLAAAQKDKKAQDIAEKQVVENAKQIAASIEPFYGKAANEKLFGLLAGHYGAIKDYLNATIPKPNEKLQKAAVDRLTANAQEIASFLSGANPNLPKGTLIALLSAHGGHHVAQINEIQKKNFAGEAETWGGMKHHMYAIADALAGAIAKQFPEKF